MIVYIYINIYVCLLNKKKHDQKESNTGYSHNYIYIYIDTGASLLIPHQLQNIKKTHPTRRHEPNKAMRANTKL